MDIDFFGLKRKRTSDSSLEGQAFTFEERAELFDDLLEEDQSLFPLLEAPHEVLAGIGACLDAKHLAALSELCSQAYWHLDEAFADAWTCLLLRDHMPRSRAKRYRADGAAFGDTKRAAHHSAGLVLTAVDLSCIEWDGMLVSAPSPLRYRFLQTLWALKSRWGRLAQSWEWFATRAMHRMTHRQLARFVPSYQPPARGLVREDDFDEVLHQASLDRDQRARHNECNHQDVIASMKRRLGLKDDVQQAPVAAATPQPAAEDSRPTQESSGVSGDASDVLSAMAPTARDQKLQAAAVAAAAATAAGTAAAAAEEGSAAVEMPPQDVVERMSFSEQLELALRVSQASEAENAAREVPPATQNKEPVTPKAAAPQEKETTQAQSFNPSARAVLCRLKTLGSRSELSSTGESLEIVLKEFTAGEAIAMPEQLRRSVEQIVLRLAREDWLLLYEGIALEAQLRARTVAHHCRLGWESAQNPSARRLVDLEAVLLQLPLYETKRLLPVPQELEVAGISEERHLARFLEAWEEHEAWLEALGEHLGPLDMEVSRERSNNIQRKGAHTPYSADLCRLAFRNFAICEGRLFFALALAVYGLISRLLGGKGSERSKELLESLHIMARAYEVQDDALAAQRKTLQEFQYYLLEPLKRACKQLAPAWAKDNPDPDFVVDVACG